MSYLKKLRQAHKIRELNNTVGNNIKDEEEEDLNESYEARYIKEMNNDIEEAFQKKGEDVGMNEMCNNVIDNIISGKEVNELFHPPTQAKTRKTTIRLPRMTTSVKENENKKGSVLYSEKFIKPSKKNYKDLLILPLIKYNYKSDQNIKFREGETEKILAYEYYQNSYKKCVQLNKSQDSLNAVRENYKMMWNYVNVYGDKKNKEKNKSKFK